MANILQYITITIVYNYISRFSMLKYMQIYLEWTCLFLNKLATRERNGPSKKDLTPIAHRHIFTKS